MQSQKIGMGRTTKLITEYKQTSGDADGDNIVEIWCWWGWCGAGTKYFTVSSSLASFPGFRNRPARSTPRTMAPTQHVNDRHAFAVSGLTGWNSLPDLAVIRTSPKPFKDARRKCFRLETQRFGINSSGISILATCCISRSDL